MGSDASSGGSSYNVFVGYNSAHYNFVENIARKLRDEGLEPYFDRRSLVPSKRWSAIKGLHIPGGCWLNGPGRTLLFNACGSSDRIDLSLPYL